MFCAGFFHTRKNLKNFSKEVIKSHLAVLIWCGKRDKHFSNHKGKEVRLMKPSDFQKTVQCRFESCLKKVVRSVVKDYYKELNRRKNKEISFSELPDVLVDKMAVWDDYETDYTIFSVCGIDIRVLDDELAEALKKLPERKRNAEVYKELWPEGIVCALNDFARAITDNSQKNIMAQQMLTISEIWKDLSEKIGSPQLIVTPERKGIRLADIAE